MSRNMVTKALAEDVKSAMDSSMSVDEVRNICENFLTVILDKVKGGEEVTLTNFLKIKRVFNKERTFKIPRSEETTTKPDRYSINVKVMAGTKSAFEALPIDVVAVDTEEEKPKPKKAAPVKKAVVKSDTEEEEEKPKKAPAKKAVKSDTEEEEEPKKAPAPVKTKKAPAKGKKGKKSEEEDVLKHEQTEINAWTFDDEE